MAKPRIRVPAGRADMDAARFGGSSRAYEGSSYQSQELAGWNASLGQATDEYLPGRDTMVARSRDLVRNDVTAQGGVDKRTNAVVGADLWVSAKPDWRALGFEAKVGFELARQFESIFTRWGNDPWFFNDLEGELNWGGLVELAYRHVAIEAEAVAVIYGFEPVGLRRFATQVLIVDPDRLCTPSYLTETPYMRGGIETNRNGRPIAYHIQQQHPNAEHIDRDKMERWSRIPRYSRAGRPQVIHYYDKTRAGLKRGVSKLAAALKPFKQFSRYVDAELNAKLLTALIPLFITSSNPATVAGALAPADDSGDDAYMDQRAAFHEESKITFNGARIPALYDNEDIKSVDTKRDIGAFSQFEASVLRRLAGAFNLTYEQLSNDWANVNYSSARAALIEIWRSIDAERTKFTQRFCTPIYQAVIWEAVVRGMITLPPGAPDFVENLALYTRCQWIGPGRGWVDPVKEATAAGLRTNAMLTTLEKEAAEQGEDIFANMEDAARIRQAALELGLPDPMAPKQAAKPGAAPQREEEEA